jgi:hypothetical protein
VSKAASFGLVAASSPSEARFEEAGAHEVAAIF